MPSIEREGRGVVQAKRRQSFYFPQETLDEMKAAAASQDRSLAWVLEQAWRIARGTISRFPQAADTQVS